jgi:hypothetical protein
VRCHGTGICKKAKSKERWNTYVARVHPILPPSQPHPNHATTNPSTAPTAAITAPNGPTSSCALLPEALGELELEVEFPVPVADAPPVVVVGYAEPRALISNS